MTNTNQAPGSAKRTTTLYTVNFRGLFGRNRSVKSWWSPKQVEAPADESKLDEFLAFHLAGELASIGAKRGVARVVRYSGCEVNDYGNGVTTYIIPITQGVDVLVVDSTVPVKVGE